MQIKDIAFILTLNIAVSIALNIPVDHLTISDQANGQPCAFLFLDFESHPVETDLDEPHYHVTLKNTSLKEMSSRATELHWNQVCLTVFLDLKREDDPSEVNDVMTKAMELVRSTEADLRRMVVVNVGNVVPEVPDPEDQVQQEPILILDDNVIDEGLINGLRTIA